ncbi:hypothetical protein KFL_000090190 [Klebsormidium nitens]|uniref:Pentatricopeptide repeat domain containing protein n=1 Tax=Klebsormidium nitens TaxID=105231 RepID=A0A1Y1HI73_KLENI|nr:hypothetical protein KFL_000090190 [Klebsormidium nitens]|eukprot:GAQ78175.1 hypothetical protein KFL_000090190 [Klebsormidium nitens]
MPRLGTCSGAPSFGTSRCASIKAPSLALHQRASLSGGWRLSTLPRGSFLSSRSVLLAPASLRRPSGNGGRRNVVASAARSGGASPGGSPKRQSNNGREVPLFSGRMADFVSNIKRPDATSGGGSSAGGSGEVESDKPYRIGEAIKQARERILRARQSSASSKAESAFKAASEPVPPKAAPKPEPVKQTDPVDKPDPVKTPKPRARARTASQPEPEVKSGAEATESPPPQAKAPRAKATRAKATRVVQKSVVEADAPRRFISGPEGVVAILEKPTAQKKVAKPAAAPKAARAKKAEAKPKVARRRAVTKAGESEQGADDKILEAGKAAGKGLEVSEESAEDSEGLRIRGAASVSTRGSKSGANGTLKENGATNGLAANGTRATFVMEEPTLASAALPRAAASKGEGWVMTTAGGGGSGTITSVTEKSETEAVRGSRSNAAKASVSVGGNGHPSSAEEGEAIDSGTMREEGSNANRNADKSAEKAMVAEQRSSPPESASEKPTKTESVQNGKSADTPQSEKRAGQEPPPKNRYAAKKGEAKKDPKEKLAGIRGGLVDRIVASPKVSTVLAAGGSGLDTPSMVRLLKDLSVKETAVKKPGLTAKTFAWLRKNKAPLDPVVYTAALEFFARDVNANSALETLADMREQKIRPSADHVAHVIAALRGAGRFREAADVVANVGGPDADVSMDATCFNGALRACIDGRLGAEKLFDVYAAMQKAGVTETADTYDCVIDGCLLAKGDPPAVGWVAEKMQEKGFTLDRAGARAIEQLLSGAKVDEAWDRFINWKPSKGRWSGALYVRMLDGLLARGLAEDVSLHVSEMQRHKLELSADQWERVKKLTNPPGSVIPPPTASASAPPSPTVSAFLDVNKPRSSSEPPQQLSSSEAGGSKSEPAGEGGVGSPPRDAKVSANAARGEAPGPVMRSPLQTLSDSLVKRATEGKLRGSTGDPLQPEKRLVMKEVWTPTGKFFTAPRVVPSAEGGPENADEGGASTPAVSGGCAAIPKSGPAERSGRSPSPLRSPQGATVPFQGVTSASSSGGGVSRASSAGGEDEEVPGDLAPYWKLIQVQIAKGRIEGAAETLDDVRQMGLVPTAGMFKVVVVACGKAGLKDAAWNLIRGMQESGHIPTPDVFEALR